MIPVQGYKDARVGVLGLGRSGLSAARALREGGATPICWDDNEAARAKAEAEGFETAKLTGKTLADLALLITSPGIPHLYPTPNPVSRCSFSGQGRRVKRVLASCSTTTTTRWGRRLLTCAPACRRSSGNWRGS